MTPMQRFMAKVATRDECWLWIGGENGRGYGRFWFNGKLHYAHRWAYESTVGPIPRGLDLDHLCATPACVNPAHLEPVTRAENLRRSALGWGGSSVCRSGRHSIDDPSSVHVHRDGSRQCRACLQAARARLRKEGPA